MWPLNESIAKNKFIFFVCKSIIWITDNNLTWNIQTQHKWIRHYYVDKINIAITPVKCFMTTIAHDVWKYCYNVKCYYPWLAIKVPIVLLDPLSAARHFMLLSTDQFADVKPGSRMICKKLNGLKAFFQFFV